MFNQRQWTELNAFSASFGSSSGSGDDGKHGQHQPGHLQQQYGGAGQQPPQDQHQHQHQQQQFFQQPQPPSSLPIQQHFQHQQHQQPEQLPFQYDFSPREEWPKFSFDQAPSRQEDLTGDFGGSTSNDMDWTPSGDFQTDFSQQFRTDGHDLQHIKPEPESFPDNGSRASGVDRLIAQFEHKDVQPALPPRPIGNAATSPIAIGHQANQFDHFQGAPQGQSFTSNPFQSASFASNRVHTPSDSHFGSYGTSHSRVMSPIATSPPPASFGSFHDRLGSPGIGQSSDPFGSLDDFVAQSRMGHVQDTMISSPAPTTPSVTSSTPGFSIWRPPGQGEPQQQQQQQQSFQHYQPPQHYFQQPQQPQSSLQRPASRNVATSPGGGYFRPPSSSKTTPTPGSQFILELNPGSKAKGKAPAKPPKPKAPKPFLPVTQSGTDVKDEPLTPSLIDVPELDDIKQESTPRPSIASSRASREQVPAEAWEGLKSTIRDLYLVERKPLKQVMSIMAEKYNFQATPKMYKTRFSQWGFVKNNTEEEVKKLLSMKFQRDAEGKVSEFVRNGKIVNLGTYLKRKGVTEYDLVDFELPANLPSHIRCRTPTPPPAPEWAKAPDLVRAQELVVGNMRKAFAQCRQWELETQRRVGWPSIMVWGAPSSEMLTEANFYFEAGDVDSGGQCLMNAFDQLEIDLKQLSPQAILEVILGMVRRDPGLMTALCKYVGAFSTTNHDRAHPLRQVFTCLYEVQQKHGAVTLSEMLWGSIALIAEELEAIYGRRHPYVARTWIDLAVFYDQKDPEKLEKLALELKALHRQMEQERSAEFSDLLALRYAVTQLFHAADANSTATKQAAGELLADMKKAKLLCRVKDARANTYCYHCAVKNDPWTKRCRRRYDTIVELLEKHTGVKIIPYFEEDFHTIEHAHESQESWGSAMAQSSAGSRWGFL